MPLSEAEELELLTLERERGGGATTPTAVNPVVAEYAGGVNRGVAGAADFFLTDPLNTLSYPVRQVMGDVAGVPADSLKLPTFSQGVEHFGGRNFMEPGLARDVVQTAGEWTPSFATMRPNQLLPRPGSQKATDQMLQEAAPSFKALKQKSDDLYKQIDDLDVVIRPELIDDLATTLSTDLRKLGLNPKLTPKSQAALAQIQAAAAEGAPISAGSLETLRKVAGIAAKDTDNVGKATADAFLGGKIQSTLDDFVDNLGDDALVAGKKVKDKLPKFWGEARRLVHQRKKAEQIEVAIELAKGQASGFGDGLVTQFRQLSRRIVKGEKGWTPDEIEAINKVVRGGGKLESVYKALGKFGMSDVQVQRMLLPSMGAGAAGYVGNAVGGPIVGAASAATFAGVGQLAKTLATRSVSRNAHLAEAVTRAGKNGRKIAAAYLKNTPKEKQVPEELAALLLANKVPIPYIETMSKANNTFIANAGFLAGLLRSDSTPDNQ